MLAVESFFGWVSFHTQAKVSLVDSGHMERPRLGFHRVPPSVPMVLPADASGLRRICLLLDMATFWLVFYKYKYRCGLDMDSSAGLIHPHPQHLLHVDRLLAPSQILLKYFKHGSNQDCCICSRRCRVVCANSRAPHQH